MNKRKNKRGITLIALVITIIVLLIIAGTSINMITSQDGILGKAVKAKEAQEKAAENEKIQLEAMELLTEYGQTGEIVNRPNIKTGMIPVKWNGENWVKADEQNSGNDWYDYSIGQKKWANVVTVKETGTKTRQAYISSEVGTVIPEEDITTMWVWIPRFAYKIASGYHTAADGTGNIEIEWLIGKSNIPISGENEIKTTYPEIENDAMKDFVVHPAFTSNTSLGGVGEEITGFWVGKFESSNYKMAEEYPGNKNKTTGNLKYNDTTNLLYGQGDGTNVTIKPNVTSWKYIQVDKIFNVCQAMKNSGNIHGLGTDSDTIMMENSQWGAVAYLAQSDYGNKQTEKTNSGIWNNPYIEGFTFKDTSSKYGIYNRCTTLTGMVGTYRDASTNYYSKLLYKDGDNYTTTPNDNSSKTENSDGSITIRYMNIDTNEKETTDYERTFYHYDSTNGVHGSTTGTIYGIYDMAGGSYEYMASCIKEGTAGTQANMIKIFKGYKYKYRTIYEVGDDNNDRNKNYNSNAKMYGDSLYETSIDSTGSASWNSDYSIYPYFANPFFKRGGTFGSGINAGVFSFTYDTGGASNQSGFRVVVL